jgi:hypothetical protein
MLQLIPGLFASILVLFCTLSSPAQTRIELSNPGAKAGAAVTRYRYLFENERFTTPLQEVEFGSDGRGSFRFKRKDREEIVNPLAVSPLLVAQVSALFDELNFLDSQEDYQFKKDFSHLGRVTINQARGGRDRTVSFNYTSNPLMNRLLEIFRNLATQETRVFDIETIRSTDPISMPAQLRQLESELRSKRLAEPHRLLPLLTELRTDESLPLIARNHAERLIQAIKKEK